MGIQKTLGGDRLGAGRKMTQELHGFGRSSHNVSKIMRTDQAIGTIVPAWCQIGTTGTTFYVDLEAKTRTLPTNGPIFASMKHQIDVFVIPMRLYIGALHNNMLGIGLNMKEVKFPVYSINSMGPNVNLDMDANWQQISQDSLVAYLGMRQIGNSTEKPVSGKRGAVERTTQALFLLAYWDIYKNYYANKQEGIGYVIGGAAVGFTSMTLVSSEFINHIYQQFNMVTGKWATAQRVDSTPIAAIRIQTDAENKEGAIKIFKEQVVLYQGNDQTEAKIYTKYTPGAWTYEYLGKGVLYAKPVPEKKDWTGNLYVLPGKTGWTISRSGIKLNQFNLSNIDDARLIILSKATEYNTPVSVNYDIGMDPYIYSVGSTQNDNKDENGLPDPFQGNASWFNQAGLGIRTYLSDRYNNWLSTEWIDGTNGINEITAIQIVDNKLSMDALIMQKKIFDMLNRVAISGGSYNDWQEAVYGVRVARMAESPIYMGGASYEIVFSEVVSNSSSGDEPLGTLAGRGVETNKKGGRSLRIKCEEPSLIMALSSYVPRVDYSQGNKWWTRLETMDDLHKPNLDAIGFQELITDEICALDTQIDSTGQITYKSAGKQVSWQEYMTDTNETFGDFSVGGELDWMAFNRSYNFSNEEMGATDITTYIDPVKFNVAFANAKLSAKNLWSQIAFNVTARRVMSAKQIPNL